MRKAAGAMDDIVLYQYALSPFCEKVRIALGYKRLVWRAVEIPAWPPRPDAAALTAGYRRAPVMQIGADIYCDTLAIPGELERHFPTPTLYPQAGAAAAMALSGWADAALFVPSASLATATLDVPRAFIEDRRVFMGHGFSRAASVEALPANCQRVTAAIRLIADMLGDGPAFLFGEALSVADLAAWHPLWFVRGHAGEEPIARLPFAPLADWMARIAAIGHDTYTAMDGADAVAVARSVEPSPVQVAADDPSGLVQGQSVRIMADEPQEPIAGTLLGADPHRLVIAQDTDRVGRVHVHFPRVGDQAVADRTAAPD